MRTMKTEHKIAVAIAFLIVVAIVIYILYEVSICRCEIGNVRF